MFCVKCNNNLEEGQLFCTSCGHKVGTSVTTTAESNSTESKNNKNFEEKSAEIISDVKGTVNNIMDKGVSFADKIKNDDKVNEYAEKIKSKPNTVKIIVAAAAMLLVLVTGFLIVGTSTPEKSVKGFVKNLEKVNFDKAISYTNFDSMLELKSLSQTNLYGQSNALKPMKDQIILELKKEFVETFAGAKLDINNITVVHKSKDFCSLKVTITTMMSGDIDTDTLDLTLVKKKGKWIINFDSLDMF